MWDSTTTVPTAALTPIPTPFPPVVDPTASPTTAPTNTAAPTAFPTLFPTTAAPTLTPTPVPTTASPTAFPTPFPTTNSPTAFPTLAPTTASPSSFPTPFPITASPTAFPTLAPTTTSPTAFPTPPPTTPTPTSTPTARPTASIWSSSACSSSSSSSSSASSTDADEQQKAEVQRLLACCAQDPSAVSAYPQLQSLAGLGLDFASAATNPYATFEQLPGAYQASVLVFCARLQVEATGQRPASSGIDSYVSSYVQYRNADYVPPPAPSSSESSESSGAQEEQGQKSDESTSPASSVSGCRGDFHWEGYLCLRNTTPSATCPDVMMIKAVHEGGAEAEIALHQAPSVFDPAFLTVKRTKTTNIFGSSNSNVLLDVTNARKPIIFVNVPASTSISLESHVILSLLCDGSGAWQLAHFSGVQYSPDGTLYRLSAAQGTTDDVSGSSGSSGGSVTISATPDTSTTATTTTATAPDTDYLLIPTTTPAPTPAPTPAATTAAASAWSSFWGGAFSMGKATEHERVWGFGGSSNDNKKGKSIWGGIGAKATTVWNRALQTTIDACATNLQSDPLPLKMGFVIGSRLFHTKLQSDVQRAVNFVSAEVAKASRSFGAELNVKLLVTELYVDDDNVDHDSCNSASGDPLLDQLFQLQEWGHAEEAAQRSANVGAWYRFDSSCTSGTGSSSSTSSSSAATATGKAYLGGLCSPWSAGVVWTSDSGTSGQWDGYSSRDTWRTFAHELGHTFGTTHPFTGNTVATGATGGIMDYGAGARFRSFGTSSPSTTTTSNINGGNSGLDEMCIVARDRLPTCTAPRVMVWPLTGKPFTVAVDPQQTIEALRSQILNLHGVDGALVHPVTWVWLDSTKTVADYGLGDGDELFLYNALCFKRDATALVPAPASSTSSSPMTVTMTDRAPGHGTTTAATTTTKTNTISVMSVPMASLRAGDKVLVADPATGDLFVDRVSINLHVREASKSFTGVTLALDTGAELSVTPDHVVLLAGEQGKEGTPAPARDVKVGDTMLVLGQNKNEDKMSMSVARVTAVGAWRGGIINPLTHSGRILAGAPSAPAFASASASSAASVPPSSSSFALATTVFHSPGGSLLRMATMPSLFKLGSLLFPTEIQASCVVESASDLVAFVTLLLNQFDAAADVALDLISSSPSSTPSTPSSSARAALLGTARHAVHSTTWGLAIATFALFDLTLGLSFVAYWSAHHALAALAAALVPLTQTVMAVGPLGPLSSATSASPAVTATVIIGVTFLLPAATTAVAKARAMAETVVMKSTKLR